MNRRKLTGIVGSIVVALLGTVMLVGWANSKGGDATAAAVPTANVLVVQKPVKAGTPAAALGDAVAVQTRPQTDIAAGAATSVGELGELVATVDLQPGEQVLRSRFIAAQDQARGKISPELLTITLPLPPERALGGRITPGFRVAVVALFQREEPFPEQAKVIVNRATVAAVQTVAPVDVQSDTGAPPAAGLLVTLATDVAGVERLVYAQDNGAIFLVGQPEEAPTAGSRIITRENVFP